jgi:hypothetical protein
MIEINAEAIRRALEADGSGEVFENEKNEVLIRQPDGTVLNTSTGKIVMDDAETSGDGGTRES